MVQTDIFRLSYQPRLMVLAILVRIPTPLGPQSTAGWLRALALDGGCWPGLVLQAPGLLMGLTWLERAREQHQAGAGPYTGILFCHLPTLLIKELRPRNVEESG